MEKMRYFLLGFGLILFAIWAAVLETPWFPVSGVLPFDYVSFAAGIAGLVFLIIGFRRSKGSKGTYVPAFQRISGSGAGIRRSAARGG